MKSRVFATLTLLTLLTAATVFAQGGAVMEANIPFEFRVGTTVLPPGQYNVRSESLNGVLSIRCHECKAGALILTNGIEAGKIPETGKLVFNRFGKTYFLSTVWTPGYSLGRELPKSKAERELARNNSPATASEVVLSRR
jgi:hypothetical protein